MFFEKINENQIRCTLNRQDLAQRDLNLKELTYGSDKARELFQEMLETAFTEYGFDAEDIPIMIEAVPLPLGNLMLVITKVEEPEELDTRYARFSPASNEPERISPEDEYRMTLKRADEIMNLFQKAATGHIKPSNDKMLSIDSPSENDVQETDEEDEIRKIDLTQIYQFKSLDAISEAAKPLSGIYEGINSLYKEQRQGLYYLAVNKSDHTPETFNQVCNILSEYGDRMQNLYATEAFLEEHCKCIIHERALQVLASL